MSKFALRIPLLAVLTAALVMGLGVMTTKVASAQNPCGPGTTNVPYNTSGNTFNRNVCTISATVSYQAFEFTLIGPAPHMLHVDTCGDSGDTVLQVYQAPGGAPGAFNPLAPGTNQLACTDDNCGLQSSLDVNGLAAGNYTIVVSNWSSTAGISGNLKVRTPQCVSPAIEELPVAFADPLTLPCTTGRANLQVTVTNTGLGDIPNLAGPEFSINLTGTGGGAIVVVSIASGTGGPGQTPGAAPLGGTGTADLDLPAGASDTITMQLAFPNGIGSVGGILATRTVWADLNQNGALDAGETWTFEDENALLFPCGSTVYPNNQLGKQVHLPILNFQGQDDVCESWIEVQNLGCENAKAALVTWGEPGFCPPQAAGPLKVECTGMLKPGSTWNLYGAQVPTGSKSGILFKLSANQLSEDGIDLGFDDVTGDYVCELLFFGVVGDADDYRRFKKAYNEGLDFQSVNMERASGEGLLAVDVHRTCPGDATPGVDVTSKYNGLAGTHLGTYDDVYGGYSYYVPLVYASAAGFNTIIYIQNGGLLCSSLEIWFKARDDCLRATICDISTLAPGETYQLDANDCVGPDFQGSAWIRSTQVMGIAVDIIGGDVLMTYVGEPGEINYTFDPNKSTTKDGNQVAFGPLIYSEYQGWDTGIQVQNLSPVFAAKVKVYFLDRSGDIITTLVDWVCPRGSQTFFLPVVFDLPGNWVGSMRAESQEWITPGGPNVLAPNIVGVVTLIKYNDVARTQKTEAIAYNLLPEHKIYDWQLGQGGGGLYSGIGLIAIPSVLRDLENSGLTSEIAIANVVPKPGFTDLVIYFYDQNGLLDYICQKLNEKQVEYLDLQTWGYINDGFKGSAIISAWFWEHDVFDDRGFFLRNLVGLGAVAIERKGTHLGEDVPGDEAAGDRGIPFANTFDEEGDPVFEFCFMGPAPLCPGFADNRAGPGDCANAGLGTITTDITQGPPFHTFQTNPQNGACSPNPGFGQRNINGADLYDFTICKASMEIEIVDYTLTPFSGGACGVGEPNSIYLAVYTPDGYTESTPCDNLVWSIMADATQGSLFNLGGRGDVFAFDLPPGPGDYKLMAGNVCDTNPPQSVGPVTLDLR